VRQANNGHGSNGVSGVDAVRRFAELVAEQTRERCARMVEAMDTEGHAGYIETTGDLCDAMAARIRGA